MNFFEEEDTQSPAVMILAGAVLVLSLPPVRRALRVAAGSIFHGMLAVAHDMEMNKKKMKQEVQQTAEDMKDVFEFDPEFPDEKLQRLGQKLKKHSRHVAVLTAAGALSIVDRTKPFVDEIHNIIQEAKEQQSAKKKENGENGETASEFERELTKQIPIHPGI